ncbi:flavin reductase family protein [Candidatus Solirubrobacter pratensis]|uniref:flavin reductase family protein n=1 Tax=Candidatus Solirubrobacter pratensis TaxID=1298857 RepID=UPI00041BAE33|nr:flavin reductase family protein [Candidatus Solirubrobacter pratensis]
MVFYEPHARDRALLPHDPFKAIVAPRPIGWVSTIGPDGELNLAPYSFFNAVGEDPPMIGFSSTGAKDSATFAAGTGEFVWNMPTWDLREAMNQTSKALPRGQSEFGFAGLEAAPSRLVAPPRVAAAHCALECRVVHQVELKTIDGAPADQYLVVGQVIGVHIDEAYITDDGRVDTAALKPIARCGYREEYAVVESLFAMWRP